MAEPELSPSLEVSQMDLHCLARNLPNEKWKPLGRNLGLSETDLDNIVANPQHHNHVEQCYQMLLLWHTRAEEALWEKLKEALRSDEVGCPHLARRCQTSETKPGFSTLCSEDEYPALNSTTPPKPHETDSYVHEPPVAISSGIDAAQLSEPTEESVEEHKTTQIAPQQSTENQTGGQDTDPQQQQAKPNLNLRTFSAYSLVQKFSYNTTLVAVSLTALMLMQISLVSMDCYESYNIRSEHSNCSCSFPYPWLVTAALRITSRFAYPLLLSIVFWLQVVYRKAAAGEGQLGTTIAVFADEIVKVHNHKIVRDVVQIFWDPSVKVTDNVIQLLERMHDRLNTELTWMCNTSLIQSVLLVISMFAFNLADAPDDSTYWLGVVDILSFGIVTAVSGVMLSFYFLESEIKRYVRAVHTLTSPSRTCTLHDKAKRTEHCITNRWYPLEIGMDFASEVIPIILVMNWASDTPLSCGFSVSIEAIKRQSAAACWMGFIVVVTVGQVMVTSPFNPFYIRCTGLSMEVAILSIFYLTFPTYEWIQLTHVLYAIVPLSYLVWYHIASIRRQWLAINQTKEGNPTYVSRLASRTGLLILILAALVASLRVEYSHLHPSIIVKYSGAAINAHAATCHQPSCHQT